MNMTVTLPTISKGRRSTEREAIYQVELEACCAEIKEINSRLDFSVSSRGWCYLLEEFGLSKGNFDQAEKLINDCRKSGLLPLDICSEDAATEICTFHDLTGLTDGGIGGLYATANSIYFNLQRKTGGYYDGTNYDSTPFNRAFITLEWET